MEVDPTAATESKAGEEVMDMGLDDEVLVWKHP